MSISFEDAVDEILTGEKKTHEASLAQRLKEHSEEQINIKKILREDDEDEPDKNDEKTLKKRIQDKENDNSLDNSKENKEKEKIKDDEKKIEKKKKIEFLENLEKDEILIDRFSGTKYKVSKDPEGEEVLRTYIRINSKNVDIKRFGSSEILQYGTLSDLLGSYGYTIEDLAGSDQGSLDNTLQQTSTVPTKPENENQKEPVDSFTIVLKKIMKQNSGSEILCASKSSAGNASVGATVTIFNKTTSFDDRKTALDTTDLQYQQLVLTDISGASSKE